MSFITKRERVFNEYDLCDLPSRNEGKLKAYASCTDARAWSHFCSDKTEHLVDIIKRNNETCRPKYVPTDVIINTLMVGKNAEIARLRRKIGEFEQMLSAYDDLELSCEQKCEIANAHATIRAANKELDDLSLDLDLSGFTEGIDSEAFETGKSRGDELCRPIKDYAWSEGTPTMESKGDQIDLVCTCDAATSAHDPRIDELQDQLITKDAKLNAMHNTIAVMENDVCEPYCIYAHIYTALEKIFGILCQNDKYKQYLDLLSAGKDTRCLDIKGKILFKLKVLEKFGIALIAPCTEDFQEDCACDHSTIIARVETALALTPAEVKKPLDSRRTNLVADIMGSEDIKDILNQDGTSTSQDDDQSICIDNYSINTENLARLKNLQENYEDLMQCYEDLKYEKNKLLLKCNQYDEQEKELEELQTQLRNYNMLWNEKEHYRRRSEDLDSLKNNYLILADETTNLETQLKAEAEMNMSKNNLITDLRNQNIILEKKLNDCIIACEKEKSSLQCKLKETECKVMCQEQEIKCLAQQINRLLEQEHISGPSQQVPLDLINEVETLKAQIVDLKDALQTSEEEKSQLQNEFEDKLSYVNELKIEIMDWKTMYEKTQQSSYFDNYEADYHAMTDKLLNENRELSQTLEEKHSAVENLMGVIKNKSQEIDNLREVIESKKDENRNLVQQISHIRDRYESSLGELEIEKEDLGNSLSMARRESEELLQKVKSYDEIIHRQEDLSKLLQDQKSENHNLRNSLVAKMNENKQLQKELENLQKNNAALIQDIQQLNEANKHALNNINSLRGEKSQLQTSFDLAKKESKVMEKKLSQLDVLKSELESLNDSYRKLCDEKEFLKKELHNTESELLKATNSYEVTQKESVNLMEKLLDTENLKENFVELSNECKKYKNDNLFLQNELLKRNKEFGNVLKTAEALKYENAQLANDCARFVDMEQELLSLKNAYDELLSKKSNLQNDFNHKSKEITNLYETLEDKVNENQNLAEKLRSLQLQIQKCQTDYAALENENSTTQLNLDKAQRDSKIIINDNNVLENELANFKRVNDKILSEKEALQKQFDVLQKKYDAVKKEKDRVIEQNDNLSAQCENFEESLTNARKEILSGSQTPQDFYDVIQKEVENLKKEKHANQKKIRDLLDHVDESDNLIASLKEEISARDNRISVLQNHINNLEEEVRRLHESLDEVINVGEQIRDNSIQKMDKSLKQMEAHHSRATHNIQLEVAKLRNKNMKLEERLSSTELENKESISDKHRLSSQLNKFRNERDTILSEIKQLDIDYASDLSPDSPIEQVIASLNKIKKTMAAKESKSSLLEQTLLKMQSSSQLVLDKADEAKRIAEKEKEKILNEKEEVIKERLKLEKQMDEMKGTKERLENELSQDKDIIKDLEAEILNQKLIIDKINRSREDYINKLKDELETLQKLYKDAILKLEKMKEKEDKLSRSNDENLKLLQKAKTELKEKSTNLDKLEEQLNKLMVKPSNDVSIQCDLSKTYKNVASQTDKFETNNIANYKNESDIPKSEYSKTVKYGDKRINTPRNRTSAVNEYQVLTANVNLDDFDAVKNTYFNYKMKRLSPGRLEQHSIGNLGDTLSSTDRISISESPEILDNRQSSNTELLTDFYPEARDRQFSPTFKNDTKYISNRNNLNDEDDSMFFDSVSNKSADKDLFVIYKDKENDHDDSKTEKKYEYMNNHQDISSEPSSKKHKNQIKNTISESQNATDVTKMFRKDNANAMAKPKLHIDLARVMTDNISVASISDDDNISLKSLDSDAYLTPKRLSNMDIHENSGQINTIKSTPSLPNVLGADTTKADRRKDTRKDKEYFVDNQNRIQANNENNKTNNKIKPKLEKEKRKDLKINKVNENIIDSEHNQQKRIRSPYKKTKSYNEPSDGNYIDESKTNVIDDDSDGSQNNFGYKYILDSVRQEINPDAFDMYMSSKTPSKSKSEDEINTSVDKILRSRISFSQDEDITQSSVTPKRRGVKKLVDRGVMAKSDIVEEYENKINSLTRQLEAVEKDCKTKIDAIKLQYDSNIRSIINEHNQGVNSIQSLHEDTLQDFIKLHENEVENLRSMSIEAMRRVEKLQKENRTLRNKTQDYSVGAEPEHDEEPVKMSSGIDFHKRRRSRIDTKILTKTNVEAFNVRPKTRTTGPCTCTLDINVSDTIRNIFEQVDVEQRKLAENSYLKYIANKIINSQVESLDAQELSFLHLKVCRNWKVKLCKEEALQKKIDSLESELFSKQRHAQINIAELDRKVAEERRRLHEVREAVCRTPLESRETSPDVTDVAFLLHAPPTPPPTAGRDLKCHCNIRVKSDLKERKSAGDLGRVSPGLSTGLKPKRVRQENNRASLAKLDVEDRKEKRHLSEEMPTRLRRRRSQERHLRINQKR